MYRRKYRSYGTRRQKKKYSNETTSVNIYSSNVTNSTFPVYDDKLGFTLVPKSNIQGTRKVKNMTIQLSSLGCTEALLCAVVYCPGNLPPQPLVIGDDTGGTATNLYEPNQNVIMQFVLNPTESGSYVNTQVQRFSTRLARNLDSNDYIALVCRPARSTGDACNIKVVGTFNYCIAY